MESKQRIGPFARNRLEFPIESLAQGLPPFFLRGVGGRLPDGLQLFEHALRLFAERWPGLP
jgi:hypothetical protein